MTWMNLGTDKNGKETIHKFEDNASIIIEGLQGSGKSFLATLMLSQMGFRNQLIVDYEGEHFRRLRETPVFSKHRTNWLPSIYECHKPFFDFNTMDRFDLEGLNIPEGGSLVLAKLSRLGVNWEVARKMIEELPTTKDSINRFNQFYNMNLIEPINRITKNSLVNKLEVLDEIFEQKGEEYFIPELWMKYKQVTLNFAFDGMHQSALGRARLFYGKYLHQIWNYLYDFKPVIFVEEAKIFCPNLPEGQSFKSQDKLDQFMLHQRRRTGSMLILVVQDEKLLSLSMQETYSWKIKHMSNDRHGNRWFLLGDNNFWKKGKGRHRAFKVHKLEYL